MNRHTKGPTGFQFIIRIGIIPAKVNPIQLTLKFCSDSKSINSSVSRNSLPYRVVFPFNLTEQTTHSFVLSLFVTNSSITPSIHHQKHPLRRISFHMETNAPCRWPISGEFLQNRYCPTPLFGSFGSSEFRAPNASHSLFRSSAESWWFCGMEGEERQRRGRFWAIRKILSTILVPCHRSAIGAHPFIVVLVVLVNRFFMCAVVALEEQQCHWTKETQDSCLRSC